MMKYYMVGWPRRKSRPSSASGYANQRFFLKEKAMFATAETWSRAGLELAMYECREVGKHRGTKRYTMTELSGWRERYVEYLLEKAKETP